MSTTEGTPRTATGGCVSCGAYGGSQHRPTCQPGKKFKLGRSRRARHDARASWAVREKERVELELIGDL